MLSRSTWFYATSYVVSEDAVDRRHNSLVASSLYRCIGQFGIFLSGPVQNNTGFVGPCQRSQFAISLDAPDVFEELALYARLVECPKPKACNYPVYAGDWHYRYTLLFAT